MINVLSKETIDKIAAGEVVERPESVVKELLENAVDSGAGSVSVEIRNGGLDLIRVTDNGCGIAKEDIPLAFLRHATSKLRDASDLFHIRTMGFRGEALASICGVSETEMITKRHEDLLGYRYEINGGAEKSLQEVGAPDGTTMIVRNLFYNVPARKKFLRSGASEGSRIADITEKTALAHPELSFRLTADGRSLLHTSGNGRLRDVIFSIYGREVEENLLPVGKEAKCFSSAENKTGETGECGVSGAGSAEEGVVLVSGYIGKPVIARSRRDFEVYFVNGRFIKSSVIEKAVEEAFKPFMMVHKFPFVMLKISVNPERVDVNVHPKKMEVRFSDNEAVYDAVYRAVSETLARKELITEISPEENPRQRPSRGISALPVEKEARSEPFEEKREAKIREQLQEPLHTPLMTVSDAAGVPYGSSGTGTNGSTGTTTGSDAVSVLCGGTSVKEKGQQNAGEKVCAEAAEACSQREGVSFETGEKERSGKQQNPLLGTEKKRAGKYEQEVLFRSDKFLSANSVPSFRMIGQLFETYWLIEFSDKLYIIDQHAAHEKVNYERTMRLLREKKIESQMILPPIRLSVSAEDALLMERYMDSFTALGYEIEADGPREFLVRAVPANLYSIASRELLLEMIDGLSEERGRAATPDILRDRVASMSCKAAVKGNRYLSEEEMKALIGELLTLDNPYACPHGRPTIISMSKYELDKKFRRIV